MDDAQKRAFDFVVSLRDSYSNYHHRKEREAYVVAVLFLGATAAALTAKWPSARILLLVGLAVAAVLATALLTWHLSNRRFAARLVSACTTVASRWLSTAPLPQEYSPTTLNGISLPDAVVREFKRARVIWTLVALIIAPIVTAGWGAAVVYVLATEASAAEEALRMESSATLIEWLTLSVLALTGGVVAWYTVETHLLRRASNRQIELLIRPFLSLHYDPSDRHLHVTNIGKGVAREIEVAETVLTAGESETRVTVRWEPIDVVASDSRRQLIDRAFVVDREGETELTDSKRPWAANFGASGTRSHRVVVYYRNIVGDRYVAGFETDRGATRLEYDKRA